MATLVRSTHVQVQLLLRIILTPCWEVEASLELGILVTGDRWTEDQVPGCVCVGVWVYMYVCVGVCVCVCECVWGCAYVHD